MTLLEKVEILAGSAKYDASCASSGPGRAGRKRAGANLPSGCCHSFSSDGRCISLLKILMSNICIYDCAYCLNRCSNDIPRAAFTPEELAKITMDFYRKNYIEGLFLSSAVTRSPDFTMNLLVRTLRILRLQHRFRGYIHLKLIPGASRELLDEGGFLADRVSINVELPTRQSLALLAPEKTMDSIFLPMKRAGGLICDTRKERKVSPKTPVFSPAGQSTQMIVGATPESDLQIMKLSEWMYSSMNLKRVYYSAYVPVNSGKNLPALRQPPLLREHRLYQADWLLRFYGFCTGELLDEKDPFLDSDFDPKTSWALRHPEYFPVEINAADYEALLRVPGIGVTSAQRIISLRKVTRIAEEDLKKLKVVMKRARHFVTLGGRRCRDSCNAPEDIRKNLLAGKKEERGSLQLDLFSSAPSPEDVYAAATGEM